MRAVALGLLFLTGCGPVMLGEDLRTHDAGTRSDSHEAHEVTDAGEPEVDAAADASAEPVDASPRPSISVNVKSVDCGKCFELQVEGSGGRPPYAFQWEDGTLRSNRRVCVEDAEVSLAVFALDSSATRSAPQIIRLEGAVDAGCVDPPPPPSAATPPSLLCLENLSFEGTPVANLGQPDAFNAPPWSACTSAATTSATPNVPSIANDTLAQNVTTVPKPTNGLTYLALAEGQQVSQAFCSTIDAGATLSLTLDLSRVDFSQVIMPDTEQVFLEIWGGLAVDCSQRELLWASPALKVGWNNYCVTLHPHSFMNQITLRANADLTAASPAVLLLDNLKPMDSCP